ISRKVDAILNIAVGTVIITFDLVITGKVFVQSLNIRFFITSVFPSGISKRTLQSEIPIFKFFDISLFCITIYFCKPTTIPHQISLHQFTGGTLFVIAKDSIELQGMTNLCIKNMWQYYFRITDKIQRRKKSFIIFFRVAGIVYRK